MESMKQRKAIFCLYYYIFLQAVFLELIYIDIAVCQFIPDTIRNVLRTASIWEQDTQQQDYDNSYNYNYNLDSDNDIESNYEFDMEDTSGFDTGGLMGRAASAGTNDLPEGDIFDLGDSNIKELECGKGYSLVTQGHIYFKLTSQEECTYNFIGSKVEGCTVAFLCEKSLKLASPSSGRGYCDVDFLRLEDGTGGRRSGCGKLNFRDIPRIPRKGGTDMYVTYRGRSDLVCVTFCVEQLDTGSRPALKDPQELRQSYSDYQENTECTCGRANLGGRVVGGEDASRFEFPWIGAIVDSTWTKKSRNPFCGGQLINNRYFLTAAHCLEHVAAKNIQVLLHLHVVERSHKNIVPGWDLPSSTDEEEKTIRKNIEEIIMHPLYIGQKARFDYDIALLKFDTPLDFNSHSIRNLVTPICLPLVNETFDFEDGEEMTVAGWGDIKESDDYWFARLLQKVHIQFIPWKTCRRYAVMTKRHICAGVMEGGKDACQADSGGPLIYKFNPGNNQYLLSGIVSAGIGCARKNKPGWYTNVQELVQWVYLKTIPDSEWCTRDNVY